MNTSNEPINKSHSGAVTNPQSETSAANQSETMKEKQNEKIKKTQSLNSSPLSKYRVETEGNIFNVATNIWLDGEDTNIPLNLPTFIVGSKNSGKSTIISALITAGRMNDIYKRIIYVYTDHVDTTLAEACHVALIRIPLESSIEFISKYFKIKSEFMSWTRFIDHLYRNKLLTDELTFNIEEFKRAAHEMKTGRSKTRDDEMSRSEFVAIMLNVYTDNIIDEYVRNSINQLNKQRPIHNQPMSDDEKTNPEYKILSHAMSFIKKYSEPFEVSVDDVKYHIEGLRFDQYDQLIIDDVGVAAPYLFPTTMRKSPLYKFLTISRHILLGTVISGQDIMQLPKYARKEVNTWLFGVGLDPEIIQQTPIPKNKQKEIERVYDQIKQYDFVIYNGLNNNINVMRL